MESIGAGLAHCRRGVPRWIGPSKFVFSSTRNLAWSRPLG
jgi:hypothetical protein